MSVVGIGADLVAVPRIAEILERHGVRFLERCFRQFPSPGASGSERTTRVAARWAAKEAFLKALGADVRSIPYRDIQVEDSGPGPEKLVLHGRARAAVETAGGQRLHLSLSRAGVYVLASVLIET